MKNIVIIMLLCLLGLILLPFVGSCQDEPLLIMQGYGESRESPIKVEAGSTIQTSVPLFLVNEPRYPPLRP